MLNRWNFLKPGFYEGIKFWIALLISNTYRDEQDYYRGLYLVTEAAASASWVAAGLSQIAIDLLDLLVTRCEQEDSSGEYDFPSFQWLDLFAESYELLSIYQEIDADAVMPNECEPGSPQFMAWHFGQLVGKFAVSDERWAGNTLDKTKDFRSAIGDDDIQPTRGWEKTVESLALVDALLCEYEPVRDWERLRQYYEKMWHSSDRYALGPFITISPVTDLFWAMRLGFCGWVTEQQAAATQALVPSSLLSDVQTIKEIASTVALRQLKLQTKLDEEQPGLPPTARAIRRGLQQHEIGQAWKALPSTIDNALIKAERYYRTEVDDDSAKVGFHKAVEATLEAVLAQPLANLMKARRWRTIVLPHEQKGTIKLSARSVSSLSVREWAFALEQLDRGGLASLAVDHLREFLGSRFQSSKLQLFKDVASSLREVAELRGGSAHHQAAESRHEEERSQLDSLRKIVLGIGRPSVISQLFGLLLRQDQPRV